MATANYLFNVNVEISGERASSGNLQTVPMQANDYGQYDTVTQKFSLYPYNGNIGLVLYASTGLVNTLVTNGVMQATGAMPGSLPTAH